MARAARRLRCARLHGGNGRFPPCSPLPAVLGSRGTYDASRAGKLPSAEGLPCSSVPLFGVLRRGAAAPGRRADERSSSCPEPAVGASGAGTGTLPLWPEDPVLLGRRTVLLVEDEESITEPLQEALAREGFDASVVRT